MNKLKIFLAITGIWLFTSCDKDEESAGVSKVTQYPIISLNGPSVVSIIVGETYDDPGAEAVEGETPIAVEVVNNVDNQNVGLYTIVYSAENQDGFLASVSRTVAVIPEEETAGLDLSGTYYSAASDLESTITKRAEGLYYASNMLGGGYTSVIPGYFICVKVEEVIIPVQSSPFGRFLGDGEYDEGTDTFSWTLNLIDQPGGLSVSSSWEKQ